MSQTNNFRLICSIALWVLAATALVACGGGDLAPPSANTLPSDFVLVEGDRVGMAVPEDWTVIDPTADDFGTVAGNVAANNPAMANRLNDMADNIDDDTLRLAAYHPDGFTSVNITAQSIPFVETTEGHASRNRRGLQALGYVILETDTVTINGAEAAQTLAEIEITNPDGAPLQVRLLQYTVLLGSRAYSLSFGAARFDYNAMRPIFEQIAETFFTNN